jgi:hypothetical protein
LHQHRVDLPVVYAGAVSAGSAEVVEELDPQITRTIIEIEFRFALF